MTERIVYTVNGMAMVLDVATGQPVFCNSCKHYRAVLVPPKPYVLRPNVLVIGTEHYDAKASSCALLNRTEMNPFGGCTKHEPKEE